MKKQALLFLIFSSLFFNIFIIADDDDFNFVTGKSKTFFSVPPIYRPTSPEEVSIRRDQLRFYDDTNITIEATVFGGRSTDNKNLERYFMPFGKKKIVVGELGSKAVKEGTVDVIANYFGILTSELYRVGDPVESTLNKYTFQSELTFNPRQIYAGVAITYKQHLSRYTNKGFWFEIVLPVEYVKNELCIHEKIITPGGPNGNDPKVPKGFFPNMKAAFKQDKFMFGKIDGPKHKVGIADLYAKVGYVFVKEETHQLNSYIGFSAPTGNVPTSEFLFEPVVGNNGHSTLFIGTSAGFRIWSQCEKSIYLTIDTLGTMYFANDQTRSMDLKDKSWSRYMWVYLDKKATGTSPGINVFTHRVEVTPGTTRDLNTAYVYKDTQSGIQVELGYHFFSRQAEEIQLARCWRKGPAIAAIIKDKEFITGGTSRNNATINEYLGIKNDTVDSVEVFKEIKATDLDHESASHPAIVSHTPYIAFSYNWDTDCCRPKYMGIGGSYEFSGNNAVLSRWMFWAKFGISF